MYVYVWYNNCVIRKLMNNELLTSVRIKTRRFKRSIRTIKKKTNYDLKSLK